MLFTPEHIQMIAEGRKTQTRRVCKQGEELRYMLWYNPHRLKGAEYLHGSYQRAVVYTASGRIKWLLEQEYAVQPGRGKPAVARIRITDIRREHLQDISNDDAYEEGVICPGCGNTGWMLLRPNNPWSGPSEHPCDCNPVKEYAKVWDAINARPGTLWADNPLVWVLTFEVVR